MRKMIISCLMLLFAFVVSGSFNQVEAAGNSYKGSTTYKKTTKVAQAKRYTKKVSYKAPRKTAYKATKVSAAGKKAPYHAHIPSVTYRHVSMNKHMQITAGTDGKVLLTWDDRGGTCHFAYGTGGAMQHSTSAGCDEARHVIGGLQPGVTYHFSLTQNREHWTPAVAATATSGHIAQIHM
ncbi:MAG TPA: fibronectin type III domain-containing protein [Vitreimonas sp.]|nr:fibronectin type III domain-containing protein [Vitreimonas sp.]